MGASIDLEDLAEHVEELGLIIDSIDNYAHYTLSVFDALPAAQRLAAINRGLKDVRDRVLKAYTGLGGEDVWTDDEINEWYPSTDC